MKDVRLLLKFPHDGYINDDNDVDIDDDKGVDIDDYNGGNINNNNAGIDDNGHADYDNCGDNDNDSYCIFIMTRHRRFFFVKSLFILHHYEHP